MEVIFVKPEDMEISNRIKEMPVNVVNAYYWWRHELLKYNPSQVNPEIAGRFLYSRVKVFKAEDNYDDIIYLLKTGWESIKHIILKSDIDDIDKVIDAFNSCFKSKTN